MWNGLPNVSQVICAQFRLHSGIVSFQLASSSLWFAAWFLLSWNSAGSCFLVWEWEASAQCSSSEASLGGLEQAGGQNGICHSGCATGLHLPRQGLSLLSPSVRLGIGVWFLGPLTELLATSCLCGSPGVGSVGRAPLTPPPDEVLLKIIQNNSNGEGEGENA